MKKFILSIICLFALVINASAATAVIANQTASTAQVITTPLVFDSITLYSSNATPTIVRIYDGPATNITAAWTNYQSYVTNETYTYITSLGTTNSYTASNQLVHVSYPHAAATNDVTPIISIVVPASNVPVTFTPTYPTVFTRSLYLSNNLTGVSGIVSYRRQ